MRCSTASLGREKNSNINSAMRTGFLFTSEPILQFPWAVRPGLDPVVAHVPAGGFPSLDDPDVRAAMQGVAGGVSSFGPAED